MNVTAGLYAPTGPQCMYKQMDGLREGRCMDGESSRIQPGGELQVFPCRNRWHQTFSFGNSVHTPKGSLHMNVPLHIQNRIKSKGKDQEPFMCLGVLGRGNKDETDWDESETNVGDEDEDETRSEDILGTSYDDVEDETLPLLSEWSGEQVVTTRCSNFGGVIEWIFVPYVHEAYATYNIFSEADDASKREPNEL